MQDDPKLVLKDAAFRHLPQLRDKIVDPADSRFRRVKPSDYDQQAKDSGLGEDWRRSDGEREAMRQAFHAPHVGQDLWIFAFGSLMWDPGFFFEEVRVARLERFARRFCLDMVFGRGSPQNPGLMAALDDGIACEGLVFRIAAERVDAESKLIWQREMSSFGYVPNYVTLETELGDVTAMSFFANKQGPRYVSDIEPDDAAQRIARATGWRGSNVDYMDRLEAQLDNLGITDLAFSEMCTLVRKYTQT